MLLAVNLNFLVFSVSLDDMMGQSFASLVPTMAAAESAIGLAIFGLLLLNITTRERGRIQSFRLNIGVNIKVAAEARKDRLILSLDHLRLSWFNGFWHNADSDNAGTATCHLKVMKCEMNWNGFRITLEFFYQNTEAAYNI
ncbi:hypothetical protein ACJX0J_042413, partial [Zea mays]